MSINLSKYNNKVYYMNLALQQANKNLGNTKNNPSVGCVIVKNNSIISVGATSMNGRPHAEHNALNLSKNELRNAFMFVTLEPCSHYGKTPPCVKQIINKKIKKVFFSINDPDPRSFSKCSKYLKKNKINCEIGILKKKIYNFYHPYINYKKKNQPTVTAKIALSKDFYTKHKNKMWITNRFSRARGHLMRAAHDSIITSYKTIIEDNPKLNCRITGLENQSPTRIIIDKDLKTPLKSNVVITSRKIKTIIFYSNGNIKKINKLKKQKVKLINVPTTVSNNFNLKFILRIISKLGFYRILLEAGPRMTTSFLKSGLINNMYFFISNNRLKKNGSNNFKNIIKIYFKNKKNKVQKINLFGDKLISYNMN